MHLSLLLESKKPGSSALREHVVECIELTAVLDTLVHIYSWDLSPGLPYQNSVA